MKIIGYIVLFVLSCIPYVGMIKFTEWLFSINPDTVTWQQLLAFYIVVPLLLGISSAISKVDLG